MKAIECDLCHKYETMSGWTLVIGGSSYEICTQCKNAFIRLRDERKTKGFSLKLQGK